MRCDGSRMALATRFGEIGDELRRANETRRLDGHQLWIAGTKADADQDTERSGSLFVHAGTIAHSASLASALIAAAVMALPLMVRAMRLSIEAVDQRLEQAARTLGAGRWRAFATITLPLALPGILAGVVLGFARSLGEFGATITFVSNVPGETQTLPLAIYAALQQPGGEAIVWRLAAISVGLSLAALVVSEAVARRQGRRLHVL